MSDTSDFQKAIKKTLEKAERKARAENAKQSEADLKKDGVESIHSATPQQRKAWQKILKLGEEAEKLEKKAESAKNDAEDARNKENSYRANFFTGLEIKFGVHSNMLRYNEDEGTIEVYKKARDMTPIERFRVEMKKDPVSTMQTITKFLSSDEMAAQLLLRFLQDNE